MKKKNSAVIFILVSVLSFILGVLIALNYLQPVLKERENN
ncbi:hypothetical protein IGI96_003948, partial [Enterococcus sp. DIV0421]